MVYYLLSSKVTLWLTEVVMLHSLQFLATEDRSVQKRHHESTCTLIGKQQQSLVYDLSMSLRAANFCTKIY